MVRTKMQARYTRSAYNHICGLYYVVADGGRRYLPQVELQSHTTITSVCYHTKLQQSFVNTWNEAITELRYTFPLFDGVAVTAYTIEYDGNTLKGVVKQKDDAKQTYQEAVDRGETAGLLESLPAGVFGVSLGNVGPQSSILVTIQYVGELKHDAQVDGLRYTLPTAVAPRYGAYPGELKYDNVDSKGISITVDIDMAGSAIRKVQSPSHAIGMSLGSVSTSTDDTFQPSKGSITLTNGSTELGDDFVLQVLIDDLSKPRAIIENHPESSHRAIMTTFVPKFSLPPISPEIIFIADQSGSMSGSKNDHLVAALKVLLRSLPFGCRFNIISFGNAFHCLFDQAQAYNEDNLNKALQYIASFRAHMGGTEILEPVQAAFEKRGTLPLEVMLLTDGEIWREQELFSFINKEIHEKQVDARIFTLGIGSDVSHTLVEGVARAGNGFAQYVANEQMDAKLMRMLRAALSPHLKDIRLEVNYDDRDVFDEDFEIVEKVQDCLVLDDLDFEEKQAKSTNASSSFFDQDVNMDAPIKQDSSQRYAHLPPIAVPKLLQAPSNTPPLFPFNRSTFYILLGPNASHKKAVSVTLRAQAPTGPVELAIPLQESQAMAPAVHQLAARKAVQELEEGRGWLHEAKTADGALVKEKSKERFDELVEREAVRLGTAFSVAGKWCSFVAVQAGNDGQVNQPASLVQRESTDEAKFDSMTRSVRSSSSHGVLFGGAPSSSRGGLFAAASGSPSVLMGGGSGLTAFGGRSLPSGTTSAQRYAPARQSTGGKAPRRQLASRAARRAPSPDSAISGAGNQGQLFGAATRSGTAQSDMMQMCDDEDDDDDMAFALFDEDNTTPVPAPVQYKSLDDGASPSEVARAIIDSQAFQGYWQASEKMYHLIGLKHAQLEQSSITDVEFTKMVVVFLETQLKSEAEMWELVVEKAKQWLQGQ